MPTVKFLTRVFLSVALFAACGEQGNLGNSSLPSIHADHQLTRSLYIAYFRRPADLAGSANTEAGLLAAAAPGPREAIPDISPLGATNNRRI